MLLYLLVETACLYIVQEKNVRILFCDRTRDNLNKREGQPNHTPGDETRNNRTKIDCQPEDRPVIYEYRGQRCLQVDY